MIDKEEYNRRINYVINRDKSSYLEPIAGWRCVLDSFQILFEAKLVKVKYHLVEGEKAQIHQPLLHLLHGDYDIPRQCTNSNQQNRQNPLLHFCSLMFIANHYASQDAPHPIKPCCTSDCRTAKRPLMPRKTE